MSPTPYARIEVPTVKKHPFFANIERDNKRRELLRQAGDNLSRFKLSGDGWHLFQAFILWRNATVASATERKAAILAEMESAPGMPIQGFEAASTEFLGLDILENLTPVITDLLDFCGSDMDDNAKLTALRDALRIGLFHAPSDTKTKETKRKCVALWIAEYGALERDAAFVSETAIARRVGKQCHVSYKTALTYWHNFLKEAPWQAKWVKQLIDMALSRKRYKSIKPRTRATKPGKPRSWR